MTISTRPVGQEKARLGGDTESPAQPLCADSKLFVISLRCGRLGNRLILFANFIALAEEQGHRVINFTFHSYAHLFESTRRDIYCQYPAPTQRSCLDAIPGLAGGIRGTRLFYHATRAGSLLNERLPILGS